jgi:hypothetical protein
MAYLGSPPASQFFAPGTDTFSGTGSQTAFTLSRNVATVNDIQVVVNNVVQQPSNYSVLVNILTFSPAPSAGTDNIYVRYLSTNLTAIAPQQGSVYPSSLSTGGPTWDTLGNINVANTFGYKNRIINGGMVIDQRNNGASVTPTVAIYTLDRWLTNNTQVSKFSVQQNAGSVTPPAGYKNYLGVTSLSAYSVLTSDFFSIVQTIEGLNTADLAWGTASASTVTISFWVRSSLTGTFGGSLNNSDYSRSYPFSYTISAANTWEQKSVTIAGDTTGTWLTTNGKGIQLYFNLGAGATYSGTAGAWAGATYVSSTGATSVVGTSGATWYVTGVQLEKGATATSFDFRDYGRELAMCKYYYRKMGGEIAADIIVQGYSVAAQGVSCTLPLDTGMRVAPTVTQVGTWTVVSAGTTVFYPSSTSIGFQRATSTTGAVGTYTNGTSTYLTLSAEL